MTKNKMTNKEFTEISDTIYDLGHRTVVMGELSGTELKDAHPYRHTTDIPDHLLGDLLGAVSAIERHIYIVENYNKIRKILDCKDKNKAFKIYKVLNPEKYSSLDNAYDSFESLNESEKKEAMSMLRMAVMSVGE